jgi:hypothetical protein
MMAAAVSIGLVRMILKAMQTTGQCTPATKEAVKQA